MLVLGSVIPPTCADSRKSISPHETLVCTLAHVATQAVVWVSTYKGMSIGVFMAQCCSMLLQAD